MIKIEEIKREQDKEIAEIPPDKEKEEIKVNINEDTQYRIFFDVHKIEDEKYFYIKMIETTADAPFIYIRSYTNEDLHQLNKIFKVFDDDNFEEIKNYMNTLFKKKKIKLSFKQNEDIIKMELDIVLFADKEKISFELYREMIPYEEKDSKLLSLYSLEKNNNKIIKEISSLVYNLKGKKDKEIIDDLKKILESKEIPGIENGIKKDKKNKMIKKDNQENNTIVGQKDEEKKDNIIISKKKENQQDNQENNTIFEQKDEEKKDSQENIICIEQKNENQQEENKREEEEEREEEREEENENDKELIIIKEISSDSK